MRCDRVRELLGRERDGECAAGESAAIGRHLEVCPQCAAEARDLERIGALLASARVPPPAGFDARLLATIAAVEQADPITPAKLRAPRWWPAAAMLIATAGLSALITWVAATSWGHAQALGRDAVNAHIRSLLTERSIQIASADPHTVKPWFAGRIEVAPSIRDLASEGFPLVGGRLDLVGEKRVGVAVYKRRLHTIDVFMWAGEMAAGGKPEISSQRGYNIIAWSKAGVTYWAVSDLNAGELLQLHGLL